MDTKATLERDMCDQGLLAEEEHGSQTQCNRNLMLPLYFFQYSLRPLVYHFRRRYLHSLHDLQPTHEPVILTRFRRSGSSAMIKKGNARGMDEKRTTHKATIQLWKLDNSNKPSEAGSTRFDDITICALTSCTQVNA